MKKPQLSTFRQMLHLTVPIEYDEQFKSDFKNSATDEQPEWVNEVEFYVVEDSPEARKTWEKFLAKIAAQPEQFFSGYDEDWEQDFDHMSDYFDNLPTPMVVPRV